MTHVQTISWWRRLRYTRLSDAIRGRFNASLDWRQVIATADLPSEINDTIWRVIRRARLWRQERFDVARELVAHFQDGRATGRTTQQLILSFGDVRLATALIRRAKIRNRPYAWHIWRWGCWAFAAFALFYIAAGLYLITGRPSISTDYLAIVNSRAFAVPDGERAWPFYRTAARALKTKSSAQPNDPTPFEIACEAKPTDANWREAVEYLAAHQAELAMVREAARHQDLGFVVWASPAMSRPEDREVLGITVNEEQAKAAKADTAADHWLINTHLPHLQLLQRLALFVAADFRRAELSSDSNSMFADVQALFGISRHCQETPFFICLLVSTGVQKQAFDAIQAALADRPQLWSDDQLRDLAHITAATPIDWRSGFEGERDSFYDTLQRFYTDNGHGDGRLAFRGEGGFNLFQIFAAIRADRSDRSPLLDDGLAMLTMPAQNFLIASRKDSADMFDRYLNRYLANIDAPLSQQSELPPVDPDFPAENDRSRKSYRYYFVRLLAPALDAVKYKIAASHGRRDGTLLGIALELFHREHGKWPESLGELSPRWLPSIPTDPFNGQPLGYVIKNDRPLVYSIGADGDDDGGRVPLGNDERPDADLAAPGGKPRPPDGDWVIWSAAKSQTDE